METIAGITSLLLACGVIFTAIFQAKNSTEKTLREQIEHMDKQIREIKEESEKDIKSLKDENKKWEQRCEEFQAKYDELFEAYQKEKLRGDKLEKKVNALGEKRAK